MGDLLSTTRGDFYIDTRGPEQAQPIVFVAGLGDDHSSWSEIVAMLSDTYHCITFDNRLGRALSRRAPPHPSSLPKTPTRSCKL